MSSVTLQQSYGRLTLTTVEQTLRLTNRLASRLVINVAGTQGPPGPSGNAYEFSQPVAATSWTVNHNMGFRPSVELFTTGWQEMVADVVHTSVNQFVVYFNQPTAGYARAT